MSDQQQQQPPKPPIAYFRVACARCRGFATLSTMQQLAAAKNSGCDMISTVCLQCGAVVAYGADDLLPGKSTTVEFASMPEQMRAAIAPARSRILARLN